MDATPFGDRAGRRNRFGGEKLFERFLEEFFCRLRLHRPFRELVIDGATIEDSPIAGADGDGFAGASDAEQAGYSLGVILQDWQWIAAQSVGLLNNADAVILRIGIDHPD